MQYPSIEATRLTGAEPILDESGEKASCLNDFWSWAYSNTVDNAQRGILAEYLVACALGVNSGVRTNWDKYDLVSPEGISVEVKSSGYIQSWEQETINPLNLSQWEFYLLPTKVLNEKAGEQRTAQLSSLIKMGAEKCAFGRIHQRIAELV